MRLVWIAQCVVGKEKFSKDMRREKTHLVEQHEGSIVNAPGMSWWLRPRQAGTSATTQVDGTVGALLLGFFSFLDIISWIVFYIRV